MSIIVVLCKRSIWVLTGILVDLIFEFFRSFGTLSENGRGGSKGSVRGTLERDKTVQNWLPTILTFLSGAIVASSAKHL